MKSLLIQEGRFIDPGQGLDKVANMLITEGIIVRLGKGDLAPESECDVIQAKGLIVCPGFIDLHCHLREPGFEAKETIATGTMAAARGGFTTVFCMPNTEPPLDNVREIENVRAKANAEGIIRVLPVGCTTKGRQGKELTPMGALASTGVFGFSDDGSPVLDARLMRQALEWSWTADLLIIDHCEDTTLTTGGVINEGKISQALGLPGMPAAAEEIMVARDIKLAEKTGGRLHIAHVSTAGSVELIRQAKAGGIPVTAEVTPHHLTLTEEKVQECGTQAKVNPPLRTAEDVKALIQGLKDGVIDIIATDHAPHTEADKQGDLAEAAFGISGFETAFGSLMGLVHREQITLIKLIAALTSGPMKIIGNRYGRLGTLATGAHADITIFDPNKEWLVNPGDFASKGKNTPWAGATLKGKVMATIYQGRVVYKDGEISLNPSL
ncbi:MAG: dihydroorotase [Dehalococcoidales bacterium]|nr:dihydroorotase [Dehalococcoidales bacterium]